ncbi:hypothetical protein [Dactylosporangium sp. CA-139066]|uniref:hypothetical protein n=1 Tax=Dactylosporangium sp. CA-139066 TaxID=3239930 RepID=UPI003D91BA19
MHPIVGTWDVRVKTPIGTVAAVYTFAAEPGGGLSGTATAGAETVPLTGIAVAGATVTWRQAVTRPMRLNLDFEVVADGDALTGHSRAGRLPRSSVTGVRQAPRTAL